MNSIAASTMAGLGIASGLSFLTGLALAIGIPFDDLAIPLILCGIASISPFFLLSQKRCNSDQSP